MYLKPVALGPVVADGDDAVVQGAVLKGGGYC